MLKTQKLTPEVYYNRSRDFQLLGRIYDIIFNYIKTTSDMVSNYPYSTNSDTQLVDLVCHTLGFAQTHEYNLKQLNALCSVFMLAIKNKGNINSIEMILNLITNVEDVNEKCLVLVSETNPYLLEVYVPVGVKDVTLLQDILDYILPAGMMCKIIKQELIQTEILMLLKQNVKGELQVAHAYDYSQVMRFDMESGETPKIITPTPTLSDVAASRLDNMSVVAYDINYLSYLSQPLSYFKVKFNNESNLKVKFIKNKTWTDFVNDTTLNPAYEENKKKFKIQDGLVYINNSESKYVNLKLEQENVQASTTIISEQEYNV